MWTLIAGLMAMIVTLRLYTGYRCVAMAWRKDLPPITKKLCWALTAIQAASLFSFLGRVQSHWGQRAEFDARPMSAAFLAGQFISLGIAAAGILVVLWLVTRVFRSIGKHERLATVMITTPAVDVKTSELGLTAREVQVLEALAEGKLSDQQIADAFHITPATAATHVRNILRKAELHNRRDLVLFYKAGELDPQR
jgi:DNA-binding CsgD family transcriptional regulator